jgi:hypothetical protein
MRAVHRPIRNRYWTCGSALSHTVIVAGLPSRDRKGRTTITAPPAPPKDKSCPDPAR